MHRDLKLDNILATEAATGGGDAEIKVIDFGLSTVLFPHEQVA